MENKQHRSPPDRLLHLAKLNHLTVLSMINTLLMAAVSIAGIVSPTTIYPREELIQGYLTNDVINLIVGVPSLLVSIWLARRGVLAGLLLWPGALMYVIYNYTAYLIGMPLGLPTIVYIALVLLSAYSIFDLLRSIDRETIKERLSGGVPERLTGWLLVAFGVLFTFRALGMLAPAITEGAALPGTEVGVLVADISLSLLMIPGGIQLLQRKSLGYASGLGLLFAASSLFVGLILFLLLQPILTAAPFVLTDVIVIFLMGMICFIPLGLYLRGVISTGRFSDVH
jgi:hypothetical protein